MRRLFKKHWSLGGLAGALTVLGLLASGGMASAAAGQSITMSPTSVDQEVQPGSVANGSFQVINSGGSEYVFKVYSTPYSVKGEDYSPDFTPLPGKTDVTKWFHFSNGGTGLGPRQTITIDYTVNVPANAPPGGYYAVAFAETQSKPSSTTGVVITDRVGEIFYLRVAGNVKQTGKLLTWQASFLQAQPLTGVLRVEDSGGYNFPTTVKAQVKNIFGHDVYKFTTDRQILPQTIRRIKIPWPKTPPIGIFKIQGTATFLGQTHQLPAKYVLVVSHPIRLVIIILLIALVLYVIYRWRRNRHEPKNVYRRH